MTMNEITFFFFSKKPQTLKYWYHTILDQNVCFSQWHHDNIWINKLLCISLISIFCSALKVCSHISHFKISSLYMAAELWSILIICLDNDGVCQRFLSAFSIFQNDILYAVMGGKKFCLQDLWRRFYDSLEQPDPKHSIDIIHHLHREQEHTFLLRKDEEKKADDVWDLSTKPLIRSRISFYACVHVCVCACMFLYLLHSEYQNTCFTRKVRTF